MIYGRGIGCSHGPELQCLDVMGSRIRGVAWNMVGLNPPRGLRWGRLGSRMHNEVGSIGLGPETRHRVNGLE